MSTRNLTFVVVTTAVLLIVGLSVASANPYAFGGSAPAPSGAPAASVPPKNEPAPTTPPTTPAPTATGPAKTGEKPAATTPAPSGYVTKDYLNGPGGFVTMIQYKSEMGNARRDLDRLNDIRIKLCQYLELDPDATTDAAIEEAMQAKATEMINKFYAAERMMQLGKTLLIVALIIGMIGAAAGIWALTRTFGGAPAPSHGDL